MALVSRGASEPGTRARVRKVPWLLAVMLGVTLLAAPGTASAQLPTDSSAVDQYVEDLPTTGGSSAAGGGKPGGGGRAGGGSGGGSSAGGGSSPGGAGSDAGSAPSGGSASAPSGGEGSVSKATARALAKERGAEGDLLSKVATSPAYGAPQNRLGGPEKAGDALRRISAGELDPGIASDMSAGEVVSAAVGAVHGGDTARLTGLFVVLALIAGGALAAVAMRQRRRPTN